MCNRKKNAFSAYYLTYSIIYSIYLLFSHFFKFYTFFSIVPAHDVV